MFFKYKVLLIILHYFCSKTNFNVMLNYTFKLYSAPVEAVNPLPRQGGSSTTAVASGFQLSWTLESSFCPSTHFTSSTRAACKQWLLATGTKGPLTECMANYVVEASPELPVGSCKIAPTETPLACSVRLPLFPFSWEHSLHKHVPYNLYPRLCS